MNWLSECFAQETKTLNLSLWVYPPAVLGPDGPVAQPALCAPYPGIELVFSPGGVVHHGDRIYELPARYDSVGPVGNQSLQTMADGSGFFREVTIYAPSPLNREAVIVVNKAFSFTPLFAADGAPGFVGQSTPGSDEYLRTGEIRLPWLFSGYVSI
ncbi:hypothetical protein [Paraburkholderia diazotrophica]|uniref:Uncharacterized protein n=1 Tax=Paraburkholderia diazotrophica TaxID=667676 RepID=A0A1H7EAC8_9BURK|nr:hypothetical protein [Paraburkholderia diazotrophica]SEK10923.1 hypothetical protein SAMN05192539_104946 [Paraburkholderia diazotrophica]